MVIAVHDLLLADAALVDAVRAAVPAYRTDELERWLRRTLLPLDDPTLAGFCRAATATARLRDPGFAALTPDGFAIHHMWSSGAERRKDTREGGIGWDVTLIGEDIGPAETVHVDDWTAVAHGDGWTLEIRFHGGAPRIHDVDRAMTSYLRVPELRALARTDPAAFADALAHHHRFGRVIVDLAPLLQADTALATAVRDALAPYRHEVLDRWLRRRVLPLDEVSREAFCALATSVARERDPAFATATPDGIEELETWRFGYRYGKDDRVDEVGWVLDLVRQDKGPGEAITALTWSATAHGDGWRVEVRLHGVVGDAYAWVEP